MSKSLLIVESPAKAKTIEKYLGGDFIVKSSVGHIRDLPKSGMSIDIANGFKPDYQISPDKKKTVKELKDLAKKAETVWLATDEDREGEAIAWHLYEALDLEGKETKRIVFHEITEPAIKSAVKNPRELDKNLVDAQQARRVLDRLVGYELSPVLWKKVQRGLSAGRVQSVAVRLIAEREQEISDFRSEATYKVVADLATETGGQFKAKLKKNLESQDEVKTFFDEVKTSDIFVDDLTKKPAKRRPAPPFTTSTLQQEASRKLGFSVKQTMTVAQKLYETGKITYMRTDSVNLSDLALDQAGHVISSQFGEQYHSRRKYTTKSASAQEAHEAIRPTDLSLSEISGDSGQQKLYNLIWKRAVASQMADAELERTTVKVGFTNSDKNLNSTVEVIKFDGFLKLYTESIDDEDDKDEGGMLPSLEKGEKLDLEVITAREVYSKPPARYNEASLVRKLEEMGIGRPSTYAPTISTIQDRKYVVKQDKDPNEREVNIITLKNGQLSESSETERYGAERNKLFPTDIGKVVNGFLVKFFKDVVDYNFTAKVEEEFDEIANGKKIWNQVISEFYSPFHETIKDSEKISRNEAVQARELGLDPKSNKRVYAKVGRFGPMIQIGDTDDEEKPRFASIPPNKSMDDITLEEALLLFDLPRIVGTVEEGDVKTNVGRYGPYVQLGKTFVSITADEVYSIDLETAITKITEKREEKSNNIIQEWTEEGIQILKGRFGPYITDGKKNVKVPKDKEPSELKLEECKELIANAPAKKSRARKKK